MAILVNVLLSLTMRFPQKIALLICGCVLVLGVLCLIQYRLVRNTYRLEQAAYFRQVQQQLATKSQALSDSLNNRVMKALLNKLQDQLENGIRPSIAGFQQHIDQVAGNYRHLIGQTLLKDSLLRDIGFSLEYTKIVLYHGESVDTLLRADSTPLLLTGKRSSAFLISEGKQQVGFPVKADAANRKTQFYRLAVWNRPGINATGWQKPVLKRMFATLAGSAALIAALVLVFFLIFSALLRQKKIAEVTADFANNMTHELKTPLSAAALVVKSLRTPDAKMDEEWFDELLDQLDRQHGKIRRLMDSVLTSALEKPIGIAQLRQTRLKTLLNDLAMLANAAGRELRLAGQTEAVICTDPDLITAILSNLLDNALKYTPPESCLSLNIRLIQDQNITISLEDQGPGIERKYQRYLFQKFFRVPRTDTGQIKGLGLGLYLCRIQVQQLGGKLTYERSTSGGSIFNLILPYGKIADTAC